MAEDKGRRGGKKSIPGISSRQQNTATTTGITTHRHAMDFRMHLVWDLKKKMDLMVLMETDQRDWVLFTSLH